MRLYLADCTLDAALEPRDADRIRRASTHRAVRDCSRGVSKWKDCTTHQDMKVSCKQWLRWLFFYDAHIIFDWSTSSNAIETGSKTGNSDDDTFGVFVSMTNPMVCYYGSKDALCLGPPTRAIDVRFNIDEKWKSLVGTKLALNATATQDRRGEIFDFFRVPETGYPCYSRAPARR